MSSEMEARRLQQGDVLMCGLRGRLDETFDPSVLDPGTCTQLVLDLAHVGHVSSVGVAAWIRAVRKVRERLQGLFFVRCSHRITDQFNMIMGFDGGGSLLTFRATYVCNACGGECASVFDTKLDRDLFEALEAPARQCQTCGHDAELDDDPSVLFEYVRSTEYVAPPPAVLGLLRHEESWVVDVPGVRLTTRQSVQKGSVRFDLAGIIDSRFSGRRLVADTDGVLLSLRRVSHFDLSGFEPWHACMHDLTRQRNVTLLECPPVALRRFVDDPHLLGGAKIGSARLPATCSSCGRPRVLAVRAPSIVETIDTPPLCPRCKEQLEVPGDWRGLETVLTSPPPALEGGLSPAKQPARRAERREKDVTRITDRLADQHEVLCKLAEGGMADVFLVRRHGLMGFRRLAVIKRVKEELLTDDRMVRLFLDEAKLVARFDHPNIIRVYDLGRSGDSLYMVLEFIHGRSMSQIMRTVVPRGEAVPPDLAGSICADLARGLVRAHTPDTLGRCLVHRDITPDNVLMSFDGIVKLVDFGLAGYRKNSKWGEQSILGTPAWVAPEVYLGEKATPQTDIWAVGLLLAALLTGKVLFLRGSLNETAKAVLNERVERSSVGSGVPKHLFAIIDRCLQKSPERRYAEAAALEHDLRQAVTKLKGTPDMRQWICDLFADEIRFEQEYFDNRGSFVDALLTASADEISQFFRLRHSSQSDHQAATDVLEEA